MSIQSNTQHLKYPIEFDAEARSAGYDDGMGGYGLDHGYLDYLTRLNQNAATEAYRASYAKGLGQLQANQAKAAAEAFTLATAATPSRRAAGRSGSRKVGA